MPLRRTLSILSLALCVTGCAASSPSDRPQLTRQSPAATQPATVDLRNTVCPVSGGDVGTSTITRTYHGKTYHLCCADCTDDFEKDPDKFEKAVAADPSKYGVMSGH